MLMRCFAAGAVTVAVAVLYHSSCFPCWAEGLVYHSLCLLYSVALQYWHYYWYWYWFHAAMSWNPVSDPVVNLVLDLDVVMSILMHVKE